jgi:hypothetical protein
MKEGNLSIFNYMSRAISITDSFVVANSPLSEEEIILYILGGLSHEYDTFVTSITTQPLVISLAYLQGILVNQEDQLNHNNIVSLMINAIINFNRSNYPRRGRGPGRNQGGQGGRTPSRSKK